MSLKKHMLAGAALLGALVWVLTAQQSDARAAISNSMKAMGVENLKTLVFSGEGGDFSVGQAFHPKEGWPKFDNRNYVRSVDFEARGWRMQRVRAQHQPPRGGGGQPLFAEQNQNQVTQLNPNSPWNTQLDYIFLPPGFLKVAGEKNATASAQTVKGKKYTVLTFMGDNKAPVNGYINEQGYVERVETKIDNAVLGDVVYEAVYSDWKDFGGVKFPTRIVQNQGGFPSFELMVNDVKPNAPVDLTQQAKGGAGGFPPGAGKGGDGKGKGGPGGPGGGAQSEQLSPGVWLVTGGYGAMVVDFKDYIVILEGGQNDARSTAVMAEARRLVPNKPIRYLVNTHTHFDHAGGLRAYVAEGVTILTHKINEDYFEKAFANPATLNPGKLEEARKANPKLKAKIETMGDKKVLTDGNHVIELHRVQGSIHNDGMIMAYFPKEKVLLEADEFNVGGAVATARPANINPYNVNLLANIERLKLDVERIIPVHLPGDNRKVMLAELKMAAGK